MASEAGRFLGHALMLIDWFGLPLQVGWLGSVDRLRQERPSFTQSGTHLDIGKGSVLFKNHVRASCRIAFKTKIIQTEFD